METSAGDTDGSLLPASHHKCRTKFRKPPIDRGWAWIVMLGCFCNYYILVGLLLSGGIFFVEFLSLYEASSSITAIISGVQAGSISLGAFVSQNILLSFLQVRTIVMCGGVISSFGVILASFANSIVTMVICYSVLTGFGIGMVLVPGLVLLGKYFNKRRAIATAISMVGVNAGGMTVPLFIRFLIDEYRLSGALFIYGGIMLNSIVAGALLRPLRSHHINTPEMGDSYEGTVGDDSRKHKSSKTNGIRTQKLGDIAKSSSESLKPTDGLKSPQIDTDDILNSIEDGNTSFDTIGVHKREVVDNVESGSKSFKQTKGLHSAENVRNIISNNSERGSNTFISLIPQFRHRTFSESHKTNLKSYSKPTTVDLQFASTPSLLCVSLPNLTQFDDDKLEISHRDTDTTSTKTPDSPLQRIRNILNFSLFKNPLFLLLVVTAMFGILAGATPALYVPALAASKGLDKQKAPVLLTAVSASGIISRLLVGFFADFGCIRTHVLLIICLMCCAITFFTVTEVNDLESLMVFCVSFGFFGSLYFSLMPVIVVDFLGLENMATCYGFIEIFQGACLSASHPFIGWLRDMTGDFNLSYHFLGVASLICAFCLSLEPIARRIQERRNKAKENGYSLNAV